MKKTIKRSLSVLLACLVMMSMATVALADGAAVVVGTATGEAGDSVAVTVSVTGDGITNGVFKVTYDTSTLTFASATSTVDAEVAELSPAGTISVAFAKTTAVTGTVATLNFTIKDGASAGSYDLTPSFAAADGNYHLEADGLFADDTRVADVTLTAGSVTVEEGETEIIYGDLNGDEEVDGIDAVILLRYIAEWDGYDEENYNMDAADLNGDEEIDGIDAVILLRYIAEWDGYEELPILD